MLLGPLLLLGLDFPLSPPTWTLSPGIPDSFFGVQVAPAGDVDGDGFPDVVVGANDYTSAFNDEGGVFVYRGSALGLTNSPDWVRVSGKADSWLGTSVAAGDVDGDGYSDVVAGAPNYTDPEVAEGAVFLYRGSAAGLEHAPSWIGEADTANALFGSEVAAIDVNGDQFTDLLVDAPQWPTGGAVFVYYGSAAGLPGAWSQMLTGTGRFGDSIASAGDQNGDGYTDVLIGAPWTIVGGLNQAGAAYLYLGGPAGLASVPAWTVEGDVWGEQLGVSVASAGDVNGDGLVDVVIGAPAYPGAAGADGAAFLYLGEPAGLPATPSWSVFSTSNAFLGSSVSSAGDVDGDGYDDFLVGADLFQFPQPDAGSATLYHGGPTGPTATTRTVLGTTAAMYLGLSVAGVGDVDGNGYPDFAVAGPGFSGPPSKKGIVYLWDGPCGDTVDTDADGTPDGCDVCDGGDDALDADLDAVPDTCDDCPYNADPLQLDANRDGLGDACTLTITVGTLAVGQPYTIDVSHAPAGAQIGILMSGSGTGAGPCPAQLGGLCLDLLPKVHSLGTTLAAADGSASLVVPVVPAGAPPGTILDFQGVIPGFGGAPPTKTGIAEGVVTP